MWFEETTSFSEALSDVYTRSGATRSSRFRRSRSTVGWVHTFVSSCPPFATTRT